MILTRRRLWLPILLGLVVFLQTINGFSRQPVVVYFDSSQGLHRDLYNYHPEQPTRITKCLEAIISRFCIDNHRTTNNNNNNDEPSSRTNATYQEKMMIQLIDCAPSTLKNYDIIVGGVDEFLDSQPVTLGELQYAEKLLLKTHQPELVRNIQQKSHNAKEQRLAEGKPALGHMGYLDEDTYVTTESFEVCLRTTAAWIRALDNPRPSLALTRPPGHHATFATSNGFCMFNFAAAAAIHAVIVGRNKQQRVSILDWDVHYGQGIADIVQRTDLFEKMIRYVSIHQTPAFPYQGETRQTVRNVRTIPVPPDTTWTGGYETAFLDALDFCFGADEETSGQWKPDVVIICAGYDALASDELAGISLTKDDYYTMTRALYHRINSCTPAPKLIFGLEGGYQLKDVGPSGNLPDAVVRTLEALLEDR